MATVHAQSYGVLLGACANDLYVAGKRFEPAHGFTADVFMPFYVNDRLVVRAEAGITAMQQEHGTLEDGTPFRSSALNAAVLCRYYVHHSISFGVGVEWIRQLQAPPPLAFDQSGRTPSRTDICLLVGTAYRLTDKLELGIRYGQGFIPVAEFPVHGVAHRRYGFLTASYLLRSRYVNFIERRKWRSGLPSGSRY